MGRFRKHSETFILPKIIVLSMMIGLVIYACSDVLNEEPESLITAENFYKTAEDALLAVNASYDHMGGGIGHDDFGGVYFNHFWVIQAIASDEGQASGAINPEFSLPLTNFTWDANNGYIEDVWKDIYRTINVTNVALARIPDIDMDEQLKSRFLGECHFIRGLMYFELVRMFGDVPLFLTPTEDLSTISVPRNSADEVYASIIQDLETARDALPIAYSGIDVGRATTAAASGYLAKVHLTRGNYSGVLAEIDNIDNIGIHDLLPNYADVFTIANNNNNEILFSIQFTFNNDAIWETSQFNVRTLPLELEKNSLSWELPTQYLYDEFDAGDLRRDASVRTSWIDPSGAEFTFEPHVFKYWDEIAEPSASSSGNDFFNLRYSDILLMKAEAINQMNSGPNADAYDAVNRVRNRAGLGNLSAGLSQAAFEEAILLERYKEFVFEGQRWFDLVRMGKLKEKVEIAKPNVTVDASKHILFPIPQREIDVNPNLEQNNGY